MIIAARITLIFIFVSIPVALIAGQFIHGIHDGHDARVRETRRNVTLHRRVYDQDRPFRADTSDDNSR